MATPQLIKAGRCSATVVGFVQLVQGWLSVAHGLGLPASGVMPTPSIRQSFM